MKDSLVKSMDLVIPKLQQLVLEVPVLISIAFDSVKLEVVVKYADGQLSHEIINKIRDLVPLGIGLDISRKDRK